ncbi:MAG: hypothetical protein ABW004_02500, partial [Aeromicrobium sp.]
GAGTQGVVAAAVVTSVATAGTVAVTTDFGGRSDSSVSASAVGTTGPAPTPDGRTTADVPGSEPTTTTTPTPAPTPTPTTGSPPDLLPPTPQEPMPEPTATSPEPEPSSEPEPDPTASEPERSASAAEDPPPPEPEPLPTEEPIVPTDYGIGAYAITNDDTLLQRRFTIPVTAENAGRAADQAVTMSIQFTRDVQFRGVVSEGWDCGAAVRNRVIRTLTCVSTLPAGQGTTFIAKARGLRPAGTITVSADNDPQPANDTASFTTAPYLPVL